MHRAKGLEADVVFVYGGFGPGPNGRVRSYVVDGQRRRVAGRPRRQAIAELIKRDRDGEDQRLYYVALTRARKRLYLPFSGKVPEDEASLFDAAGREEFWRLAGGYRHVNRRLRELVTEPDTRRLLDPHESRSTRAPATAPDRATRPRRSPPGGPNRSTSRPSSPTRPSPRCAARAPVPSRPRTAASSRHTAATGRRPRCSTRSSRRADADDGELPGGARPGIFLHALLEKLPFAAVLATPALDGWSAREDVRAVIDAAAAPPRARRGRAPPRPPARARRADRAAPGGGRRAAGPAARGAAHGARDGVPVSVPRRRRAVPNAGS